MSEGNIFFPLLFFFGRLCLQRVICGAIYASSMLAAGTRSAGAKTGGEVNLSVCISLFAPSTAERAEKRFGRESSPLP